MAKKRRRRRYTPEQKAELLRRHIVGKDPVSEICNEEGLQPSVFYGWLNKLMENASTVLTAPQGSSQEKKLSRKVEALEERLTKKDNVIAEVTEAFVSLKKELGEL
jgi:transposase-like protein